MISGGRLESLEGCERGIICGSEPSGIENDERPFDIAKPRPSRREPWRQSPLAGVDTLDNQNSVSPYHDSTRRRHSCYSAAAAVDEQSAGCLRDFFQGVMGRVETFSWYGRRWKVVTLDSLSPVSTRRQFVGHPFLLVLSSDDPVECRFFALTDTSTESGRYAVQARGTRLRQIASTASS